MNRTLLITFLILAGHLLHGQNTNVYLIGDSGEPKFPVDKNLKFLTETTSTATEDDVLIFLGDNIYPRGLPDPDNPLREIMEKKLNAQLDVMKAFKGKSYIIPGNHDWAKSKKQGWKRVLNQQRYVDEYLGNTNAFLPRGGCPGPVELQVNPMLTIIIMDLQYIVHNWDKPADDSGCLSTSITGLMLEVQDIIERNKNKHLMVVAHHPMYTYGVHGGATSIKDHIFPLTQLKDNLYIPLPVIGSIYPVFRKYIGSIQDISHPKIRAIRKRLVEIMNTADNVVYANGHEHSLEYIKRHGMHFIVSGSGSKITRVGKGLYTQFAAEARGFAAVEFSESGTANLRFWNGDSEEELYNEKIYEKEIITEQQRKFDRPNFENKTIVTSASKAYKAKGLKKLLMGENYRDVWSQEIEVPVFDIATEREGLDIVKKGGGMQTRSLRLKAKNDKQYVLRSIEKYAENAIPEALRKTFAAELVQDQISASHPYGALVVPYLAEAAGIFHTNPQAVYIPEDPYLGKYTSTFAGLLALYEERPNNAAAEEPFFGSGEKIKSTFDLIEELKEDNDNRVDEVFVVRNRLFDMFIGDWDRHDDQWRWVRYKDPDGKGDLYKPIPRDRDQAFFVNEGLIPNIVSRKWALPKVEGFDEKVRWAPGLNNNARYFDRSFMTMPDWAAWKKEVKFLQENLTDEVIEKSIAQWPEGIYE
ncbi:MAG: metallophosphoesterase, partial [Cyclobacteriaceae bacterium]